MKKLLGKFGSRKFLLTVVGNICSGMLVLGVDGELVKLGSMVLLTVINIVYVIAEASIDKSQVKNSAISLLDFGYELSNELAESTEDEEEK